MSKYLVVMIGGALGTLFRFLAGSMVMRFYSASFPLGTFLINITGSFFIGLFMTLFLNRPAIHANWRLFLVTGILGGYTTFSSFEWETLVTLRNGVDAVAFLYVGLSVILGLALAWAGMLAGNRIWPH